MQIRGWSAFATMTRTKSDSTLDLFRRDLICVRGFQVGARHVAMAWYRYRSPRRVRGFPEKTPCRRCSVSSLISAPARARVALEALGKTLA